ncbi:MAG: M23 family metallopeptidase [Anaerolineae bacterium]|nr:M23 family metallopeptidase [Anaerolineae bacterium]
MKFFGLIVILLAALVSTPSAAQQVNLLIQIQPKEVQQGRTGIIRVTAPGEITRMQALFQGEVLPMYRTSEGDWIGFLAVDMSATRGGDLPVDVYTWAGETANPPQREVVAIVWGSFDYQDIPIPYEQQDLLNPDLNREELNTMLRVYGRRTEQKYWTGALQLPVMGPQISSFGGIRTYNNGALESRHTGVDYRAGLGENVMASGTGVVVFAQRLPIRGNHVVIDHGWGVLTGYSHLNEIYVVPGQRVVAGDIIGTVGATGRVQGAHMHFELTVNGFWVDPPQFLNFTVPESAESILIAKR